MRSTTTIVSLLATAAGFPAVFAAPLPAQVAAILSEVTAGSSTIVIDNRHYTPDVAVPASVVLSTPRPIATAYLMGLASSTKVRVSALVGGVLSKEASVPVRIHDESETTEAVLTASANDVSTETAKKVANMIAEKLASAPVARKHSKPSGSSSSIPESLKMEALPSHRSSDSEVPCIYAQMRRDYNDMMVISLVAVFLLVIVAVELWDSSERTADIEAASAGAIKLADEAAVEKQPLSVQASPVVLASSQTPASVLAL